MSLFPPRCPVRIGASLAVAALLLASAVWSPTLPAFAASETEKEFEDVQRKLEETRKLIRQTEAKQRSVRKDVATKADAREELAEDIAELRADLHVTQARLSQAEGELAVIESALAERTSALEQTLVDLQDAHEMLEQRAVQVYKTGPVSLFRVLLDADTFSGLLARVSVAARIFRSDERKMDDIRTQRDRIASEKAEIERLQSRAAEQVSAVERERNRVAGITSSLASRQRDLDKQISRGNATLADLEKDKAKYLREQAELEAASRRIASLLKGRRSGEASVGPGGMIWPTSGPVTSGYGYRTHPIYGTRRFHAGIDIGAPTGQRVVAAASGTVVSAGPNGGYGNAVIVDHGGGLATVYAHLSSIRAGQGAKLDRGDTVGGVGCTGTCTGPHLHFEVREDGEPRDPTRWLG